jgi:proteasome lid subunit RPN8/RPN11
VFRSWAGALGIPLGEALDAYWAEDLQLFGGIPVTLAVPRPQKVIGTGSRLELLNFVVSATDKPWPEDGKWDPQSKVWRTGHRAPLTLKRAREISSEPRDLDLGRLLFLGCGAIGSKVVLHLARSGQGKMTLADYDELSPHNLVRHGLLSESLGVGKAEGLKSAIKGMFYADTAVEIETFERSALDILVDGEKELLDRHSWLIDATASPLMLNAIAESELPETLSVCRCEIADNGRLGFMAVEGPRRNPRLDDIQMVAFDAAVKDDAVSRWLQSSREQREEDVGSVLEEINVGISCSSETMRLSDGVVSIHAATFARRFMASARGWNTGNAGSLQIGWCGDEDVVTTVVQHIDVPPFTVRVSLNDPTWQVRLRAGLVEEMQKMLVEAAANETGGILVGAANMKRRIVYVTRVLPEPPDSEGSPYAFVRGTEDVPGVVKGIEDATGGTLGYVGEWHTHPGGDRRLSKTDRKTVQTLKKTLDKVPLPTLVAVVTSDGFHPYVFAPEKRLA